MKSNYDKYPSIKVEGQCWSGWENIITTLNRRIKTINKTQIIVAIDCYSGVLYKDIEKELERLDSNFFVNTTDYFKSEQEILELTNPDVTDDEIFGVITRLKLQNFFDEESLNDVKNKISITEGITIIFGYGASLFASSPDIIVYADMARWEIQQRMRKAQVTGIGVDDSKERFVTQYKRGYFVDWRILDNHKKSLLNKIDYLLDTNKPNEPKLIEGDVFRGGLDKLVETPFRLVPFFDPGPWGGQWMKEVCDLDKSQQNFAWCFDCVPEENSLLLNVDNEIIEFPSINLVFYKSRKLLGEPVEARFGQEFPIRFDFLDTMDGGNLSFQVHPSKQYIKDQFGMDYTQDESYYMLDAKEDATVYLGLKTSISPDNMISDLNQAQKTGEPFEADKYVNKWPAKKHDHFLIPAGTCHCSGSNSMVLEISSTPYIFTFKMYDWGRMGLDGKPRPINIGHAENVIDWNRNTENTKKELVNIVEEIATGDGWREERTGLHKNEFIETRRHWFTKKVHHYNNNSVNVLNLVEGREAIVESPENKFEPFIVHYAETFVVPANVGEYTIRPYGESEGEEIATLKAYIRF